MRFDIGRKTKSQRTFDRASLITIEDRTMLLVNPDTQPDVIPEKSRRYATRYEPTRRDACLAWREPEVEFATESMSVESIEGNEPQHHFALLLDISHTGASLALDDIPRPMDGVWLRLEGECLTDWTEAEVVGVTITTRGPHLVRLAFRAPCPFETLRSAVCG